MTKLSKADQGVFDLISYYEQNYPDNSTELKNEYVKGLRDMADYLSGKTKLRKGD